MKNENSTLTFGESYRLNPEDYMEMNIDECRFSVRVYNRLMRAGITDLSKLLNKSMDDLCALSGFGKGCVDEVVSFFDNFQKNNIDYAVLNDDISKSDIIGELLEYKDYILKGDYSFVNNAKLTEKAISQINKLRKASSLVDANLIEKCIEGTEEALAISCMLTDFVRVQSVIVPMLKLVHKNRLIGKAKYYIYAYTTNDVLRREMLSYCDDIDNCSVEEYVKNAYFKNVAFENRLKKFVTWLTYDMDTEINNFFDVLFERDNVRTVICMRAKKMTLQETGEMLGVTRERVRQIEVKAHKKFRTWQQKSKTLLKISAERDGDYVLTYSELKDYLGQHYEEMIYLLKNADLIDVTYDRNLKVFIIGDGSLIEKVQLYVDSLPEKFKSDEVAEYVIAAKKEYGLSSEMVRKAIDDNYQKTGDMYHRKRLTLTAIYEDIMFKYYQNGIHVYDDAELKVFRDRIIADYGNIGLPENNRAISARLADIGLLCGRGRYCPKRDDILPRSLAQEIYEYIVNSESPIFLMNILFKQFEDKLLMYNVDNKYFLQGVLRELYEDKFVFRRDYITKDASVTSFYDEIIKYIESFDYPVCKEQIFEAFSGVTEIVLNLSVSSAEVINLFGEYIHVNKLKYSDRELLHLRNKIDDFLNIKKVCHIKDLYEVLILYFNDLFKDNYLKYPYSLFSFLEYVFEKDYEFSRPFIALKGVKIGKPSDKINAIVKDSTILSIDEYMVLAKQNHFFVYSILDTMNSYNGSHLLMNQDAIATIEYLGIDKTIAEEIESYILDEIVDYEIIRDLKCVVNFPKVNVSWNEWLIYSVINKWSDKLYVETTSNQFKRSIPVVIKRGMAFEGLGGSKVIADNTELGIVDDLDDLDNLICDLIDFDEIGEV